MVVFFRSVEATVSATENQIVTLSKIINNLINC